MTNLVTQAVNAVKVALTPAATFAEQHQQLFLSASLRKERIPEIDMVLNKLLPFRKRYEVVANSFNNGMKWWFILMLHAMEAGGFDKPFSKHLHCGDPLTGRTFHVPTGRPKANPKNGTEPPSATNPYSWEESALDALILSGYDKVTDWSIGNCLWLQEKFNGLGYRKYHPDVPTPYVWSYTSVYTKGKYVLDGKFDANAVSKQPGCAAYLLRMKDTHVI